MDRVYVDKETGEDLIHSLYDCDICRSADSTTINDAETGEPEISMDHATVSCHLKRVPFQVYLYLFSSEKQIFIVNIPNFKNTLIAAKVIMKNVMKNGGFHLRN